AFIKNAEDDVDGDESGDDQNKLRGARVLKGLRVALESGVDRWRHADFASGGFYIENGWAERGSRSKIEGDGDCGKDALVVDGKSGSERLVTGKGLEGDEVAG